MYVRCVPLRRLVPSAPGRKEIAKLLTSWRFGQALRASNTMHQKVHAVGIDFVEQVPDLHHHVTEWYPVPR